MKDPTRPSEDPAGAPLNGDCQIFVRDLTHAVLVCLESRALPLAEAIRLGGGDPSHVVVLVVETLHAIADGFEAGGEVR